MTGWSESRLSSFCKTGTGGTPSRSQLARYYDGGTIPWVKSGELRESVIVQTEERVTAAALEETSVKLVPAGALLLAMYGATVGRLGVLGVSATTNQAVCHIIPDPKVAETRYLFHALSHQVPGIVARGVGGAQPNISQGIVKDLLVPLPPLDEQRRIVEVLDRAEALRAKRRAALAQLDTLTQSIFLDLFGGGVSPRPGWSRVALGELVEEFRYGTSNKSALEGKPALRIPNVIGGCLDLTEVKTVPVEPAEFRRLQLREGDLLIVRTNGNPDYVGRCAVFESRAVQGSGFGDDEFVYASYLIRARLNPGLVLPIFLREFLSGQQGRKALRAGSKTSAGQFNINTESLSAIEVPVPPLAVQEGLVHRLGAVERLKSTQRRSLAEFDALFASLQHRAFRGEL